MQHILALTDLTARFTRLCSGTRHPPPHHLTHAAFSSVNVYMHFVMSWMGSIQSRGRGNPLNKVVRLYESLTRVFEGMAAMTCAMARESVTVSEEFEDGVCGLGMSFCEFAARPARSVVANGGLLLRDLGCRFVGSVVRLAKREEEFDVARLVARIDGGV